MSSERVDQIRKISDEAIAHDQALVTELRERVAGLEADLASARQAIDLLNERQRVEWARAENAEATLAAVLEEIDQLKGCLAARDRGLARQAWLLKNANTAHRPAHRPAAERRYIDRVLALERRAEGLEGALRRAHACATLREDGTCEGCFVSEALQAAPTCDR